MQKSGGAAIPMQQNSTDTSISFLIGDASFLDGCTSTPVKSPFDSSIVDFLDCLSKKLLSDPASKHYPDIITFAFWIRKASVLSNKKLYPEKDGQHMLGRGVVFHVAPSNVAVNFAYSMVSGLITGNINIIRVPSKQFPQVDLIVDAMRSVLKDYANLAKYICLVRYGHDKAINDRLSALADVRVIWGGDETISVLRDSPLKPRATEILFANRFSLAVIDCESYLRIDDKERIAQEFYNDTYLTDQNACSSPRIVIWIGKEKETAKIEFWQSLHNLVSEKYPFQQIQGVDKYLQTCLVATKLQGTHVESSPDNLITRIHLKKLEKEIIECFGNSGLFLEYDASDVTDIETICNDSRCQTISYIGTPIMFEPLLESGLKGVDRIVPFGKTMDFELIWDGYDLMTYLTRIIRIRQR